MPLVLMSFFLKCCKNITINCFIRPVYCVNEPIQKMIRNVYKNLKLTNFLTILLLTALIPGCGIYKKTDARKVPVNVSDRAEKNIREGKGFRVFDKARQGGGTGVFSFASSNPMWRASINLLDFAPFSNVDYSGGIIITDWFSDEKTEILHVAFLINKIFGKVNFPVANKLFAYILLADDDTLRKKFVLLLMRVLTKIGGLLK